MIDINKTYRTRDGREVRIYATDGAESTPVHGSIKSNIDYQWHPYRWYNNGRISHNPRAFDMCDLIEVRPRHKRTVWLNIYGPESFTSHISREQAEDEQDINRIACIKVEFDFEEGQGL